MSTPPAMPNASSAPPTSASGRTELPPGFTSEDVAAASEHKGCPVLLPGNDPIESPHDTLDAPISHPNIRRISLPWVADVIIVSGAEEIKAFENDPSIGRPGEGKIPGWFFALVKVSKFYCVATKRWWIGMEGSKNPSRAARVEYIQKSLANGFTAKDVEEGAQLLYQNASDAALASFGARLVARHFFSAPLPDAVVDAAMLSITQGTPDPVIYVRSARAQNVVYEFVKDRVPAENAEDVVHGIRSGADSVVAGLKAVRTGIRGVAAAGSASERDVGAKRSEGVVHALCAAPPVPQVVRIAVGSSTVNGLLTKPLVPDHTFILLSNGRAASSTESDLFLFGAGTSARQCPFKSYFMDLAEQVGARLQALRGM